MNLFDEPPRSDVDEALVRLRGLIGDNADPEKLTFFVHDGAPTSKARARWGKQRFYTPAKTERAEKDLIERFEEAVVDRPWLGNIAIIAIFYRPNRQRIDADNLMKLVMDAATRAGVWADDCQVTAQAAFIELDMARPRTIVAIAPAVSSMDRDVLLKFRCSRCLNEFERPRWWNGSGKFCSIVCARASERGTARCPQCGVEFERKAAAQAYCSVKCRNRGPRKRHTVEPPTCGLCGGPVSRREYTRCWNCAPKGRRPGSKNIRKRYAEPNAPARALIAIEG